MAKSKLVQSPEQKFQVKVLSYAALVRSSSNLRTNLERQDLLNQIKADKGILVPGYVYPESFNIDGKRVIVEGNSRHWVLEQLASDEEYLKDGGSLDFPFIELPEEVANDPIKERMFIISMGTSNQQLNPKEVAEGFVQAREAALNEMISKVEDWESLGEEEKTSQLKKFNTKVISQLIEASGKSKQLIYSIFRVVESAERSPIVGEALASDRISVSSADELIKVATKLDVSEKDVLVIAEKSAQERGNARISDTDIQNATKVLKHPEIKQFVENGAITPKMVDSVIESAKRAKTTIPDLVGLCADFGGVNEENLKKVVNKLIADDDFEEPEITEDDSDDSDDSTTTKKVKKSKEDSETKISDSEIAEAKDYIKAFQTELHNFILKDLDGIEPIEAVTLSAKIEKVAQYLNKCMK
jgi:hypothetical protein